MSSITPSSNSTIHTSPAPSPSSTLTQLHIDAQQTTTKTAAAAKVSLRGALSFDVVDNKKKDTKLESLSPPHKSQRLFGHFDLDEGSSDEEDSLDPSILKVGSIASRAAPLSFRSGFSSGYSCVDSSAAASRDGYTSPTSSPPRNCSDETVFIKNGSTPPHHMQE